MNNINEKFKISKEQIRNLYTTLKDLSDSYAEKDESLSNEQWLSEQYQTAFPSLSADEASVLSRSTIHGVEHFNTTLNDAIHATASGKSKEQWFAEKMSGQIQGMDIQKAGQILHSLDSALLAGNQQMIEGSPIVVDNDEITVIPAEIMDDSEEIESSDNSWNPFTVKTVLSHIGQGAALVGLQTMNHASNMAFSADTVKDLAFGSTSLKAMIENGETDQVKTPLTAAIKIGLDNNKLPFLPKAVPVESIASMASNGVEYISTLSQFSSGKLTLTQAMNHIGLSNLVNLFNIFSARGIAGISKMLVAQIPIVGPVLSNIVGGIVEITLGQKFQEKVHTAVQKVEQTVRKAVRNTWEAVTSVVQKIKNKVKGFCSWLFS